LHTSTSLSQGQRLHEFDWRRRNLAVGEGTQLLLWDELDWRQRHLTVNERTQLLLLYQLEWCSE